jgi:hypothetical protein
MKKPIVRISLFIFLALITGVYLLDKAKVRRPPVTIACSMKPDSSKNGYTWVCLIKEGDGDWNKLRPDESE